MVKNKNSTPTLLGVSHKWKKKSMALSQEDLLTRGEKNLPVEVSQQPLWSHPVACMTEDKFIYLFAVQFVIFK